MRNLKNFFSKKLTLIVLILAIFIAILAFIIAPLQGGLLSSTEILDPTIPPDEYPIQEVIGAYGRSISIAFVMLSHVLYANLHLGGSWVAASSETFYLKSNKERFKRLARSITLFNVMFFSLGATFAAAGIVFFIAFMPTFASNLFHIYFWPFFFEAILFAVEIVFLYVYWFSWDKVSSKTHQILGYGYAISVFFKLS